MRDRIFDSKEFKSALQRYEEATRQGDSIFMECEDLTDIAEYYNSIEQNDKARAAAQYALRLYPGALPPLALLSRMALLIDNNPDEALRLADMTEDKSDIDYYYLLAEIDLYNGNVEQAELYLEDKMELVPEEERECCYLDTTELFIDYNQLDIAGTWIDKCQDTDSLPYLETKARYYSATFQTDKCIALYDKLIDLDAYNINYWIELATAQFMKGDMQGTVSSIEYALAIDPDNSQAMLTYTNALYHLGNSKEAIKRIHDFRIQHPEKGSLYAMEGFFMMGENHIEEGIELLDKAVELLPANDNRLADVLGQLTVAKASMGRIEEALEHIDKMVDLQLVMPNDAKIMKGNLYLKLGNNIEGMRCFNEALYDSGQDTLVLQKVAYALYDCGYKQEAYDIVRPILQSEECQNDPESVPVQTYAIGALFAHENNDKKMFRHYVEMCVRYGAPEALIILGHLFPEGMMPSEYLDYLDKKKD